MQILDNSFPGQLIPVYSWANQIESGALRQIGNLSSLPIARLRIAIMPDVHQGYGMPIGGVLATSDYIVPNAVGVDIGCGMRTLQLGLAVRDLLPKLPRILDDLLREIPTGFSHHNQALSSPVFKQMPMLQVLQGEKDSAKKQLGTLGGGNHFIELQKDEQDKAWLMIHSGSRNFGLQIAKEYHQKAQNWCQSQSIDLPDRDLAYLPLKSPDGQEYLAAMQFAQDFARENRRLLMGQALAILRRFGIKIDLDPDQGLDVHHNYAAFENYQGERLLIHRKGAVRAGQAEKLIVPGSMGSPSYIGKGLGNELSFCTSAHGAGRQWSRKEALRKLSRAEVLQHMDQAGIALRKQKMSDVAEECPQAYKDIDQVLSLIHI